MTRPRWSPAVSSGLPNVPGSSKRQPPRRVWNAAESPHPLGPVIRTDKRHTPRITQLAGPDPPEPCNLGRTITWHLSRPPPAPQQRSCSRKSLVVQSAAGIASTARGEPSIGGERTQGSQGHHPPPFGYGGLAGWLPGDGPAAVGLLVFLQPVEVSGDLGVGEQRPPPGGCL